jgi:serine/threonine protein kinase
MLHDQAPTMVGPYELIRQIDEGGMAFVYLARQRQLDRYVALKMLNALRQDNEEGAARFVNEARVASSLSHPNIVTTFDYFVDDGRAYIAMEYVPNGSLRPHVQALSLPQIAGVLEGILAALGHAHSHGIVHRDVKPENVLIGENGIAKLADFGIAKALTSVANSGYQTEVGITVGTPAYMAPEQARSNDPSIRADLYSVGVMAYEMVTGRLPYEGDAYQTPTQVVLGHISGERTPPLELVPSLDKRLAAWIERMMAVAPENRPADPNAAWHELEEVVVELEQPLWRRRAVLDVNGERPATASTHLSRYLKFDVGGASSLEDGSAAAPDTPAQAPEPPRLRPVPPIREDAPAQDEPPAPPAVVEPAAPPPAPDPPRRLRRTLKRLLIGASAVVMIAGAAAGAYIGLGSTTEPVLDVRPVEARIRDVVEAQTPVRRVSCPPDVPRRPGERFACTVALAQTDKSWLAIVTHRPSGHDDIQLRLRG